MCENEEISMYIDEALAIVENTTLDWTMNQEFFDKAVEVIKEYVRMNGPTAEYLSAVKEPVKVVVYDISGDFLSSFEARVQKMAIMEWQNYIRQAYKAKERRSVLGYAAVAPVDEKRSHMKPFIIDLRRD